MSSSSYPSTRPERDRWIIDRRGPRNAVEAERPYLFLNELERSASGEIVPVSTIFLTNRECPWHCLMCDLWQNTLVQSVPAGAIPRQIDFALQRLPPARHVKLYNSGSFFDSAAIPIADYGFIAERIRAFDRVVVECHPILVGERCLEFRELIRPAQLEIALGLETVNRDVLKRLNKGMTLEIFSQASEFLREKDIAMRAFILVRPPFLSMDDGLYWTARSIEFAFDSGIELASLIPTRLGNGALEELAAAGQFASPKLSELERALAHGIGLRRGRTFADLWDLEVFADCPACLSARANRLKEMNFRQEILPNILCAVCRNGADEVER